MTSSVLLVMKTFWTRAAFVEPDFAPSASDQDWAQNILGANNANNDFDSANVAANNDGSIIERLEYLGSPIDKDLFYAGGEPYYCSKISTTDGQATTTAINNAEICRNNKHCDAGACVAD